MRYIGKNGVDAVRESHVQHFVSLVHHYVLDGGEGYRFALHQVEQASRGGDNDMYTLFQGAYLAVYG